MGRCWGRRPLAGTGFTGVSPVVGGGHRATPAKFARRLGP